MWLNVLAYEIRDEHNDNHYNTPFFLGCCDPRFPLPLPFESPLGMVVFKNQALKFVPSVLFYDKICFLSYTSSFSGNETMARRVFRLKPPKIHWEKNLYTFTQQVGRRNCRRWRKDPWRKRDRWQVRNRIPREGIERKWSFTDFEKTCHRKSLDFYQEQTKFNFLN